MNKPEEILELLDKEVNVRLLMKELTFDLDGFEQANLRQPRLYLEAGRYLTWAVLQRIRSENSLETSVADKGLELRNGKNGKLTEKAVADLVNTDEDIIKSKKRFAVMKATEVWAKQLLEAYGHRLQVLNNITKIRSGEMSVELRKVKEKAAVDEMSRAADRVRRKFDD